MKKIIINYGGYILFYSILVVGLLILCTTPVTEDNFRSDQAIASVNT